MGIFSRRPKVGKLIDDGNLIELIKALRNKDKDIRREAAEGLIPVFEKDIKAASTALAQNLQLFDHLTYAALDRENSARWRAVLLLSLFTKFVLSIKYTLMIALSDPDPQVRSAAARGLGEVKEPGAIESLQNALKKERNYDVFKQIMDSLTRLGVFPEVRAPEASPGEKQGIEHKDDGQNHAPVIVAQEKINLLPGTICIETLGGIASPVIARGTALPADATQTFSTALDNQSRVDIHLVFGENPLAVQDLSLGRFVLDGIPPAARGIPQIEVRFHVDSNLMLRVTAQDRQSGYSKSLGPITLPKQLPENAGESTFAADGLRSRVDMLTLPVIRARLLATILAPAGKLVHTLAEHGRSQVQPQKAISKPTAVMESNSNRPINQYAASTAPSSPSLFSQFSQEAIDLASYSTELTKPYSHNQVDVEHMLLAMSRQSQGSVSQILNYLGVNTSEFTERIDSTLRASPKANIFGAGTGQVFITPRVKRLIDIALQEANHLKAARISSEHIFLAMFSERNTPAARLLESTKITRERVLAVLPHLKSGQAGSDQRSKQQILEGASRLADRVIRVSMMGDRDVTTSVNTADALDLVAILDQALLKEPDDPDLLMAKSGALCCALQFKSAEDMIDRVLRVNPTHFEARQRKTHWERWWHLFQYPSWSPSAKVLHPVMAALLRQGQTVQLVRDGLRIGIAIVRRANIRDFPGGLAGIVPAAWFPVWADTPYGAIIAHYVRIEDDPMNPWQGEGFLQPYIPAEATPLSGYWLMQRLLHLDGCYIILTDGQNVLLNKRYSFSEAVRANFRMIVERAAVKPGSPIDGMAFQKATDWYMKRK